MAETKEQNPPLSIEARGDSEARTPRFLGAREALSGARPEPGYVDPQPMNLGETMGNLSPFAAAMESLQPGEQIAELDKEGDKETDIRLTAEYAEAKRGIRLPLMTVEAYAKLEEAVAKLEAQSIEDHLPVEDFVRGYIDTLEEMGLIERLQAEGLPDSVVFIRTIEFAATESGTTPEAIRAAAAEEAEGEQSESQDEDPAKNKAKLGLRRARLLISALLLGATIALGACSDGRAVEPENNQPTIGVTTEAPPATTPELEPTSEGGGEQPPEGWQRFTDLPDFEIINQNLEGEELQQAQESAEETLRQLGELGIVYLSPEGTSPSVRVEQFVLANGTIVNLVSVAEGTIITAGDQTYGRDYTWRISNTPGHEGEAMALTPGEADRVAVESALGRSVRIKDGVVVQVVDEYGQWRDVVEDEQLQVAPTVTPAAEETPSPVPPTPEATTPPATEVPETGETTFVEVREIIEGMSAKEILDAISRPYPFVYVNENGDEVELTPEFTGVDIRLLSSFNDAEVSGLDLEMLQYTKTSLGKLEPQNLRDFVIGMNYLGVVRSNDEDLKQKDINEFIQEARDYMEEVKNLKEQGQTPTRMVYGYDSETGNYVEVELPVQEVIPIYVDIGTTYDRARPNTIKIQAEGAEINLWLKQGGSSSVIAFTPVIDQQNEKYFIVVRLPSQQPGIARSDVFPFLPLLTLQSLSFSPQAQQALREYAEIPGLNDGAWPAEEARDEGAWYENTIQGQLERKLDGQLRAIK